MKNLSLIVFFIGGILLGSCSFSQPPAPPSSKNPPVRFLKVVPYSHNNYLMGYFTLADIATNQVAASGHLKLHVYTSTRLSLGTGTTEDSPAYGMKLKNTLYENTFAIGATNFHWETFGSVFTVNDLAFRFAIPYMHFKTPVQQGRVVTLHIEFQPAGTTNLLSATKQVSLY